jgi:hypothetical protein
MPGASSQHDLAGQDDDGDGEPRKNNKKKGYSTKEEGGEWAEALKLLGGDYVLLGCLVVCCIGQTFWT